MKSTSEYHGIVVVDKSAGMTSHDVVNRMRRLYQTKRVGHTGTLDPDATGILVLCLGNGTRLAEYLSAAKKHYTSEFTFGIETSTQDISGEVLKERDASGLTEMALDALLPAFRGTIVQIPPMVSARHHEGKRLYELARQGIEVEREGREIEVSELEMSCFSPGVSPKATFEITCSTGTYIRTLAFDIGTLTGVGACMSSLRRTWVGESEAQSFSLIDAFRLEDLEMLNSENRLRDSVVPLSKTVRSWQKVELDDKGLADIRQGRAIELGDDKRRDKSEVYPVAVMDPIGDLAAIGKIVSGILHPVKVLI